MEAFPGALSSGCLFFFQQSVVAVFVISVIILATAAKYVCGISLRKEAARIARNTNKLGRRCPRKLVLANSLAQAISAAPWRACGLGTLS